MINGLDRYKTATPTEGTSFKLKYKLERFTDAIDEYRWERDRLSLAGHMTGFLGSYNRWIWELKCLERCIDRLVRIRICIENETG